MVEDEADKLLDELDEQEVEEQVVMIHQIQLEMVLIDLVVEVDEYEIFLIQEVRHQVNDEPE